MRSFKKISNSFDNGSILAHSYPHFIHLCGKRSALVRVHNMRISLGITCEHLCAQNEDTLRITFSDTPRSKHIPTHPHRTSPKHPQERKRNPKRTQGIHKLSPPSTALLCAPLYFNKKTVTCSHHHSSPLSSCEILLYERQPSSKPFNYKPCKRKER